MLSLASDNDIDEYVVMRLEYNDGTYEDVKCKFFGTSVDNDGFLIFSSASPDEEMAVPDLMVATANVSAIRLVDRIKESKNKH